MFNPARWAEAFVNSLENEGADCDDGLRILKAFALWIGALPAPVSGTRDAEQAEALLGGALKQAGFTREAGEGAGEITLRFLSLLIRKNRARYIDEVIGRVQKTLNQKRGVLPVVLECAFPPGDDFKAALKNGIMKRTGAVRVELAEIIRPELTGGYKLKINDEVMDASVRFRLCKLESFLASGQSFYGDGGN